MKMAKYLSLLTLAALASAVQREAALPVTAPSRDLLMGQLNFLHTTDSHGWHAGHLLEGQYSADFGDYISLIQRMREKTDAAGTDLIVVDTGDRVEGNGLFDASKPQGLYTYDIINEVDYDVMVPGNHELYIPSIVDAEYSKVASVNRKSYIASNVDYIDPKTGKQVPLGQRYRIFHTKNQNLKVLAFGFLYNFTINSNNSVVQLVGDAIKEDWFQKAIREKVDLFLVCGHIPLDEPEFQIILTAIRSQNKYTPIQVFGSHTHIRNFVKYDSKAAGLQSGRYLETIGWASIRGLKNDSEVGANDEITFHRRYIDNNLLAYHSHTGLSPSEFPTEHGKNISAFINRSRNALNLDYKYGCAPRDLSYFRSTYPKNDSIATWIANEVLPDIVKKDVQQKNVTTFIHVNSGFFRSDIVKGPYTRDTEFILAPFADNFKTIKNVPYKAALEISKRGMWDRTIFDEQPLPRVIIDEEQTSIQSRDLSPKSINGVDVRSLDNQISLTLTSKQSSTLVPGYTTLDDAGSDGDDTLHLSLGEIIKPPPILYAEVRSPNHEETETVDIVFNSYLSPLMITLLNNKGLDFKSSDVVVYRKEFIRDIFSQWVKENWTGDC